MSLTDISWQRGCPYSPCMAGGIDNFLLLEFLDSSSRSTSRTMRTLVGKLATWFSVQAGSIVAATTITLQARRASNQSLLWFLLLALIQPCKGGATDDSGNGTTGDALLPLSFLGGLLAFALWWDWISSPHHNSSPKTEKTGKKQHKNCIHSPKQKEVEASAAYQCAWGCLSTHSCCRSNPKRRRTTTSIQATSI